MKSSLESCNMGMKRDKALYCHIVCKELLCARTRQAPTRAKLGGKQSLLIWSEIGLVLLRAIFTRMSNNSHQPDSHEDLHLH